MYRWKPRSYWGVSPTVRFRSTRLIGRLHLDATVCAPDICYGASREAIPIGLQYPASTPFLSPVDITFHARKALPGAASERFIATARHFRIDRTGDRSQS